MGIVYAGISPHPPIIIEKIGKEDTQKAKATIKGLKDFAEVLKGTNPDLIVFITPHGNIFRDTLSVLQEPSELKGSFSRFGHREILYSRNNNTIFIEYLAYLCNEISFPLLQVTSAVAKKYGISTELDHGILVPLSYLDEANVNVPIVAISIGFLPYEDMYEFGMLLNKAADAYGKRVVVVASGDLSHRLTPDAPAGYFPQGSEFDAAMVDFFNTGDVFKLYELDQDFIERAGECGLRPIYIMAGLFEGLEWKSNVFSYEGPFGVGYMVAAVEGNAGQDDKRIYYKKLTGYDDRGKENCEESPYVVLARKRLELYVREGKIYDKPEGFEKDNMFSFPAGVFVSIKKNGVLRGCIGTIQPTQNNIADEIIHNAISAGTRDPRFEPVRSSELGHLVYSVDVLGKPEPVDSITDLNVRKYGVIVRKGYKTGLLLPDLEGVDSVEEQLDIAKRKAGIQPEDKSVEIERFEVRRYH